VFYNPERKIITGLDTQHSGSDKIRPVSRMLFIIATANLAVFLVLITGFGGINWQIGGVHITCRSLSGPSWVSLYIATGGVVCSWEYFAAKAQWLCMRSLEWNRREKLLWALLVCFCATILFSAISMVRHFQLRSGAYDLGIHAGLMRNILAGNGFFDPIRKFNYLGDHFVPISALTAPLFLIWKNSSVILIFQAIVFASAGLAVFYISELKTENSLFSFLLMLLFVLFPYIHQINTFDYHPIVISIPLILWALFFLEKRKYTFFLILICTSFLTKETLSISAMGLAVMLITKKRDRKIGLWLLGISIVFSVSVNAWIMPHFRNENTQARMKGYYWKARYSNLGESPSDMVRKIVNSPTKWLKKNLLHPKKMRSFLRLFGFTGFVILFAGRRSLPVFLPLAWNLFSGYKHQWSFDAQYSAELMPYYFYAAILGFYNVLGYLQKKKNFSVFKTEAGAMLCMSFLLLASIISLPNNIKNKDFKKVRDIYKIMEYIPKDKWVGTQHAIHPHIQSPNVSVIMNKSLLSYSGYPTDSEQTNLFGVKGADYLLFAPSLEDYWPFKGKTSFIKAMHEVVEKGHFGLFKKNDTAFLFKKGYSNKRNKELFK